MINKQKDDAKKKIFDAAARLFAHKGFAEIGRASCRERV